MPEIASSLEATIERADERAAFPVELFDLDTWMLRPLAATLNLHWHVERALVRYSVRLATLTTLGVWVFKAWHLPHGYWLPFTSVVVLQPDFGATRQRAAQRVAGTVLGSLVASVLLWIHLGPVGHIVAIALCVFAFAYVLRRHYGVAIFFVTIFVVLLLESAGASTWAVMIERVCATLGGGLLAFIAALLFWPYWERERLPQYLADALRRNADYVRGLGEILRGGENAHARLTPLKRGVERANNTAFTSLRRMFADPAHQREGVERLAAIANGNQRITRLFNLVYVQLVETVPPPEPDAANFCEAAARLLILIADAEQNRALDRNELKKVTDELMRTTPAAMGDASERAWLAVNLNRAATELGALAVIAEREFVLTSAMSQNTALANPQPSVAGGASPTASA